MPYYRLAWISNNNFPLVTGFKPDVDLRNLQLPFKGIQNYTPASEIDASVNSHPPITWKLNVVEIPRPDYNGLKLSINDAEKTGDPRLRKIFRLSTEERDTPMSPKASPKATSTVSFSFINILGTTNIFCIIGQKITLEPKNN